MSVDDLEAIKNRHGARVRYARENPEPVGIILFYLQDEQARVVFRGTFSECLERRESGLWTIHSL